MKKHNRNPAPKHIRPRIVTLVRNILNINPTASHVELERIQLDAFTYKIGREAVTNIKREMGLTGPYKPRNPPIEYERSVVYYPTTNKKTIHAAIKKAGGNLIA